MILENQHISLSVSTQGAQMIKLVNRVTHKEWIWSGDPQYWPQHNPILFPIVGSTFDGKLRFEHQVTSMGNHGFTRYADFQVTHQTDNHIQMLLSDDEKTFKDYPFHFKLWVDYYVEATYVDIIYRIENHSETMMPFNFGLHPAFATASDGISSPIELEFACPEVDVPTMITKDETSRSVGLTDAFFEVVPTWIIEGPKSPYVTLREGQDYLRVYVQGYRWLAFWKKPGARFICIEPWHSHDDFEDIEQLFKDREGTLWLDPQRSFVSSIRYEIGQEDDHD